LTGGCVIFKQLQTTGENPSFLIVSFRYIGDLLVTTPLAISIKRRYPGARVEYLVFEGTEAVLAKNPYVDKVNTIPRGSRNPRAALRLFKKFDYALATNPSDRTTIWAALAGKKALGFTHFHRSEWWKPLVMSYPIRYDDNQHVVPQMLSLLEPLDIPRVPEITMNFDRDDEQQAREKLPYENYIVLHPYSRGLYKYWPAEKWGGLAGLILARTGCVPVFSVTGAEADQDYLESILALSPPGCRTFPEPLSLSQLAAALRRSVLYVGIDTMVTHLAAAVGTPTVTIFGPSFTRYWAPWPPGCSKTSPFAANRGVQRAGNVTVVQQDWDCVPCNKVFCRISTRDRFECLEAVEPEEVFAAMLPYLHVQTGSGLHDD
jgi:lipopolysaccharide heptosyltransferase III